MLEVDSEDKSPGKAAASQRDRAAKNRALAQERRRNARLHEIERQITGLESQLSSISDQLTAPPSDPDEVLRLGEDYVEIQNELEALIAEWESLHK